MPELSGAYIHLLLNHIPILGSIFALCLLLSGIIAKNRSLIHAGLVTAIIAALFAIPVLLSGEEAEHNVERMPGISYDAIETHEDHAQPAFWSLIMAGAIALGTLMASLKNPNPTRLLYYISLLLLVVSVVLMIRTAQSGGKISHPEIRPSAISSPAGETDDD
jgi:uncharacterized membrane protein